MTYKVSGDRDSVKQMRVVVDEDNRLPVVGSGRSCVCGETVITYDDYDLTTVRCTRCSRVYKAGDLGVTFTVRREEEVETDVWEYAPISEEYRDEIVAAKALPEEERSVRQVLLALCPVPVEM